MQLVDESDNSDSECDEPDPKQRSQRRRMKTFPLSFPWLRRGRFLQQLFQIHLHALLQALRHLLVTGMSDHDRF